MDWVVAVQEAPNAQQRKVTQSLEMLCSTDFNGHWLMPIKATQRKEP